MKRHLRNNRFEKVDDNQQKQVTQETIPIYNKRNNTVQCGNFGRKQETGNQILVFSKIWSNEKKPQTITIKVETYSENDYNGDNVYRRRCRRQNREEKANMVEAGYHA